MKKAVSADRRARSRWFGERLSFAEMAGLSDGEKRDQLARRLEDVAKLEATRSRPRKRVLNAIAATLGKVKAGAAKPRSKRT